MSFLIIKRLTLGTNRWQYLTASQSEAKRLTPLWSIDARDAKLWKRYVSAEREALRHPGAIVWPV